jgi:hypothetical protein
MFCIIIKRRDFTGDAENSRSVDCYYYNDDTFSQQDEAGSCEHNHKPSNSNVR